MDNGVIIKALSGFYYVDTGSDTVRCRARGKFRKDKITPLVGDRVSIERSSGAEGTLMEILPRKNEFLRPPVANIDMMVIIASAVIPVTDPFLIDRITAIAEHNGCEPVICINKSDLLHGEELFETYRSIGYTTIMTSAVTGEGIEELRRVTAGKICAFTGNSGVGKSSILNSLEPGFSITVGEVSEKLGRGRHTTRHVELFRISNGAVIADTPGFSSFDTEMMELTKASELRNTFREFSPFADSCRFADCAHVKELGCAVVEAVGRGEIPQSRHKSYVRLYEQAKLIKDWEIK